MVNTIFGSKKWIIGIIIAIILIPALLYVFPQYNVYRSKMRGVAALEEAEQNRRIAISEANAKMESAKLLAQAEIERAKGVAQANEIIGKSLNENEAYLKYLWIQSLSEGATPQVIYVPTNGYMPITEANRLPDTFSKN